MDVRKWFPVNVGLRYNCVMFPWLFNVYMDRVVREVNARVLWKELDLLSVNGDWCEMNQLLFADDTTQWLIQRRNCVDWWYESVLCSLLKYAEQLKIGNKCKEVSI